MFQPELQKMEPLSVRKNLKHGGETMGLAFEFLKEEASSAAAPKGFLRDFEGTANFLIDHYFPLMKMHRSIKKQKKKDDEKKEKLAKELKSLRAKKTKLSTQKLSEAEKEALAEKERTIKKRLKEVGLLKVNGKPVQDGDCRLHVITKYKWLFDKLEKPDTIVRKPINASIDWITDKCPVLKGIFHHV